MTLTLQEFLVAVKTKSVPSRNPIAYPLVEIISMIEAAPSSDQAHALLHVLQAVRDGHGAFDSAELSCLDAEGARVINAFVTEANGNRWEAQDFDITVSELEQIVHRI